MNETWLSGHVYNSEILHSGYCIIRKDRKTRGGGVLLGIKTALFKSVREIKHHHGLEIAMAEITAAKDMKIVICSCYRPPDADKTRIDKFESSRCLQTSFEESLAISIFHGRAGTRGKTLSTVMRFRL